MAKHLRPVDSTIARFLNDGREAAGLSYRQIAQATGMSINRIGIIFRRESPPATLGEIRLLASAFQTTASELVARAEAELSAAPEVVHAVFGVGTPRNDDFLLVANDTIQEDRDELDADFDNA